MVDNPGWLPPLILLNDYSANEYLEVVYKVFEKDFEYSKPKFGNYVVKLKRHPLYDNKSATFWHMISEGEVESERMPDIRRCERIGWIRPIMEKFDPDQSSNDIAWWIEKKKGEERFHLALMDFSYLVVVAIRKDFVLPWTAFLVEYEHQRRKLKKRYENYWRVKKS